MKCLVVVNALPDILFFWSDEEFTKHLEDVSLKAGYASHSFPEGEVDTNAVLQFFSPLVTSQRFMTVERENPYSSITCENGTMMVFSEFDDALYIALNGDGEESEDFLKRKLHVFHSIVTFHYGPVTELMKPDIYSSRQKVWKTLGSLINRWCFLSAQQHSYLVEAIERIHVNQSLSEMSVGLLENALNMAKLGGDPLAQHALLLVNTKLLALYSSRNACELSADNILMITLLVRDLFPHPEQAIPLTPNRTPPPLAHPLIRTKTTTAMRDEPAAMSSDDGGGEDKSIFHDVTSSMLPASPPLDIHFPQGNGDSDSDASEDLFYSPKSTPTPSCSGQADEDFYSITSDMLNDKFFADLSSPGLMAGGEKYYTPRAPTPPKSFPSMSTEEPPLMEEEDTSTGVDTETEEGEEAKPVSSQEYFRQQVFLKTVFCQCTPHTLHCVEISKGTVLVIISEIRQSVLAAITSHLINTTNEIIKNWDYKTVTMGSSIAAQAANVMDRIESGVRKIIDNLKQMGQSALGSQVRMLRSRWENVKKNGLHRFLQQGASKNLPPRLETCLTELVKHLKSVFCILFCTAKPRSEVANEKHLRTICSIQGKMMNSLKDYEDFLLVRGERNLTMTAYMADFPGLVHFIYVDRAIDQVTAPSINTNPENISDENDGSFFIKQKVWDMWHYVHTHLMQGYTTVAVRDGDFMFTYSLWFEDSSGNPVTPSSLTIPNQASALPGILAGRFFREITRNSFPYAVSGQIKCYELMCMHVGVLPMRIVASSFQRLAAKLWEASGEGDSPISLL